MTDDARRLVRDLRAAAHRLASEVMDSDLAGARVVEAVQGAEPGPLDGLLGVHVGVTRAYMTPDRLMLVYAYGSLHDPDPDLQGVDYALLERGPEATALLRAALEWAEGA